MQHFRIYFFHFKFYYIPAPLHIFGEFFCHSPTHIAFVEFAAGSGSELVEYKLQAAQRNAQLQCREMLKNDEAI